MNVVDSCGWLEYFADGPNAGFFCACYRGYRGAIGVHAYPGRSVQAHLAAVH